MLLIGKLYYASPVPLLIFFISGRRGYGWQEFFGSTRNNSEGIITFAKELTIKTVVKNVISLLNIKADKNAAFVQVQKIMNNTC